jgi:mono/diheme cytochrome c family protein
MSPANGMGPLPEPDEIPIQVSDRVTHGTVKPTYPVIQYPHNRDAGGDAIAGGFVYRGTLVPPLKDKLVFGDITVGRIWYADRADMLAADDKNPSTLAAIHEMETNLRQLTEETYHRRGGQGEALPGMGAQSGRGRVDFRFAVDNDGELYILTKSDGMIRKVVGARAATTAPASSANVRPSIPGQNAITEAASTLKNPVPATPESIAAGKRIFDVTCAACHGNAAQGAVKAGITISIIEEQHGKQPPDLTDDQWDHGSSDGEIFTTIKRGLPPTMMAGFGGALSDDDIWRLVNYLRTLSAKR